MNREEWLSKAVEELRPLFASVGHPLPDKIRVTCGLPSQRSRSLNKAIGEHWSSRASSDSHHEISISPVIDKEIEVLAVLVHELAHSATDGDGHKGRFPKLVKSLWLEGKPTSTFGGETFKENFADLVADLGEYPHRQLNVGTVIKKQSTRMLKLSCPNCGAIVRATKKVADYKMPFCVHDGVYIQFKLI